MTRSASLISLHFAVPLALLVAASGCDGDSDADPHEAKRVGEAGDSKAAGGDDRKARRAALKAAKASFAEHAAAYEKLVVNNDVAAIDAMWASADELGSCVTTEMDIVDGKQARVETDETWTQQVGKRRSGFDNERTLLAELEHGETFRHRTPVWPNRGINEAFGGDCAIEFHGEIWFDALVEGPRASGVRHRAYFARIGDEWKALSIHGPDLVDCDNAGDRSHMVCKKLAGEEVED